MSVSPPNPTIDYLVRQRFEQRVSVRKLAKRTGLSRRAIREVEHGDPTVSAVMRYARGLGLKLDFEVSEPHRCPSLMDLIFASMEASR